MPIYFQIEQRLLLPQRHCTFIHRDQCIEIQVPLKSQLGYEEDCHCRCHVVADRQQRREFAVDRVSIKQVLPGARP